MPRRRPATATTLPSFALYGEAAAPGMSLLHVEEIEARSSQYAWEIQAHIHQGLHQVLWLQLGEAEVILDESGTCVAGPVAVVIPPGVVHAFRFTPGAVGQVLTLSAAALAEGDAAGVGQALQTLFAQPRTLQPEAEEAAALSALLANLLAEHRQAEREAGPGDGSPVPGWLARSVVWRLARCARRQDAAARLPERPGQRALYTRWVVLLEAHYLSHWPVSRYAERLGLSEERLNRMVKAETGLTAQALLHARLAREACRRLVHVAAPVSRLAFELGFEDPAYFCRFFKRHTGHAPRAWREQAQRSGVDADARARSPQMPTKAA
ncbi:helix-turn-helix domain-containing protein [Ideonella livida]|uniref:Helix-turn-helix domain-containing protein n=1 Tax=Ideonella livida TaxID=2707176 RepID=A0A7C9PI29_9BURK|nr:helix-turn-helix domain-containing protein [Ideonella livida]NDY92537.1 helix-turn-helix domain-containing protein [Ideonella livida]